MYQICFSVSKTIFELVHKLRHEILDNFSPFPPIVRFYITKALVLLSQIPWLLPLKTVTSFMQYRLKKQSELKTVLHNWYAYVLFLYELNLSYQSVIWDSEVVFYCFVTISKLRQRVWMFWIVAVIEQVQNIKKMKKFTFIITSLAMSVSGIEFKKCCQHSQVSSLRLFRLFQKARSFSKWK